MVRPINNPYEGSIKHQGLSTVHVMCVLEELVELNEPVRLCVIFIPVNHNSLIKLWELCVCVCVFLHLFIHAYAFHTAAIL